jgi:hypothetical protein
MHVACYYFHQEQYEAEVLRKAILDGYRGLPFLRWVWLFAVKIVSCVKSREACHSAVRVLAEAFV